ncbi:MAG: hypothetical protein V1694_02210 [Candidatus Eisenbacteria bacterium]
MQECRASKHRLAPASIPISIFASPEAIDTHLLDLHAARQLEPEEYQRKKVELLNEKQALKENLAEIEKGSGGWLEPAKAFLTTCNHPRSVA